MSTVSIHCPNCGSTNTSEIKADQYQCNACKAQFNFVRPTDGHILQDTKSHYCPVCGKGVGAGKGHMCMVCKIVDFCNECVHKSPERLECKPCLKKQGKDCVECGKYATDYCQSCIELVKKGKQKNVTGRTCEDHFSHVFNSNAYYDKRLGVEIGYEFLCENCDEICVDCVVEKGGLLGKKHYCKNCDEKIILEEIEFVD